MSFSLRALRRYGREHGPAALREHIETNLAPVVRSLALENHTGEYHTCVLLARALGVDPSDLHGQYIEAAWKDPPILYRFE